MDDEVTRDKSRDQSATWPAHAARAVATITNAIRRAMTAFAKKLAAGVKAHFTKKPRQSWAKAGLSNREWGTRKIPHAPSLRKAQCPNWDRNAI